MANVKFFATCNGTAVQLSRVSHGYRPVDGKAGKYVFVGTCPVCLIPHDSDRQINYKLSPSKHKCSAKCMGASGKSCECECGGKNHGIHA